MAPHDAIVIGAGHNGFVAVHSLAWAGWKTLVLERNESIGGAIMRAGIELPGFIHHRSSTNQNLFLASPEAATGGAARRLPVLAGQARETAAGGLR
ncbi:MAG TPA: hypothetical protein DEP84_34035, partial [Chloroflexi bacterium]|nr:hypothetical protein [Chloroflexota bacterium]